MVTKGFHPYGLPLKLSFGSTITVRENYAPDYFVANLDAYGGNSGSPVINAGTGLVEGTIVASYRFSGW